MSSDRKLPRVVIIGGGFGGLNAARALKRAPVEIVLIDRANHHLFQPLLYQVATSVLPPTEIATPIRNLLRRQKNVTVLMGDVIGVDTTQRAVQVAGLDRTIAYDYLIVATGMHTSYFGHDEWERYAPGLKSARDALVVRNKILSAFELAEVEIDLERRKELMTFVIVGGGPTGVEMAGALAEMAHATLADEYHNSDPRSARILLVDVTPRLLMPYPENLAGKVKAKLEKMGVEVQLGHPVESIDAEGVIINGQRIRSQCVIWAAGVKASPAGKWLGAETDRAGRVKVKPDLSVPDHPEIFVVGDTASIDENGKPLPGVAQVAIQSGKYAARVIQQRIKQETPSPSFKYFDKGNMATVTRGYAIVDSKFMRTAGFIGKLAWAFLHILYLSAFENRFIVFFRWTWEIVTNQRGARVIYHTESAEKES
ncbi:MAG TPA: NAD(P)/FAD-dependent oxidoreductase [Anaerolineae bacterium]|nr:NAD(P)/FAD-dependent oxidoreductase [Anaerolineae bacterium]